MKAVLREIKLMWVEAQKVVKESVSWHRTVAALCLTRGDGDE